MKRSSRMLLLILIIAGLILGETAVTFASTPDNAGTTAAAVSVDTDLADQDIVPQGMSPSSTATPATFCTGTLVERHSSVDGVWWRPKYVGRYYLSINFWSNWKGKRVGDRNVGIPKGSHVKLAGGGSVWRFSCRSGWEAAIKKNPLTYWPISYALSHGYARRSR